jgi:transposase-like protein
MAGISKEVKTEILEKVKGGAKVLEVSTQYGVSSKTIYYWLRGKADSGGSLMEVWR